MTQQQVKEKILLHIKALASKNHKVQRKGFEYLVQTFYENPEDLNIEELDYLDVYSITLAMMHTFIKGLIETEEDYETAAIVMQIKKKVESEVAENIETSDDLYDFQLTNDYYNQQLYKITK